MKYQLLRLALAAPLLLLCAWPRTSVAQAAPAYAVVAWGRNTYGQTAVPIAVQSGVTAIAAGRDNTVALKTDGSVVAWGDNGFGQTTIPLVAQSGVTEIAAGAVHIVALKTDGSVVAWGMNDVGQTTVPVAAQSGVTAIAAGNAHTVALKNDGTVVAWGWNGYGQVKGTPTATKTIASPVTLEGQVLSGVTAIAAGGSHTVALKDDGTLVAWGANYSGQLTGTPTTNAPWSAIASPVTLGSQVLSGVTAVAAGDAHTVALKNDGTVVAWGYNERGEVTGTPTTNAPWSAIANPVTLGGQILSGVTAIAAGSANTLALKNDATVVAWGDNNNGQTTIPNAAQSGVTAIAAGSWHTVALVIPTAPNITTQPVGQAVNVWQSANFTVVATGYPLNYQWRKDGVDLADATNATYRLPFAQTNQAGNYTVVVSNSAGSVTSAPPAVLTVDPVAAPGTVVAWGSNYYGQTTVPIAAQSGVVAIASAVHTVALKDDGSVVAWGNNNNGQTDVPIAAQNGVSAVAAGGFCYIGCKGHTVALKNDGTVVAWGGNYDGQVTGTPATDDYPYAATASPVTLGGEVLGGVTAIAAGYEHTAALKNDGSVVAWGNNSFGQVTGTPTTNPPWSATASPVTLGGQVLSGVTAIAAGYGHTVALKNDGSIVAWGRNYEGQVTGTPPTDALYSAIASPVTLGGQALRRVTAIAAGPYQTVALIGGVQLLTSLNARPNGNELLLSWPTNAPGFIVQSTLDLTPPVTWTDSTSVPTVIGAHFTLTNTTSGGAQFYRLRKM